MAAGLSFRPLSAISSLELKDTFDFRRGSSTRSSVQSSDTEISTIPELTGAEELAIKRASLKARSGETRISRSDDRNDGEETQETQHNTFQQKRSVNYAKSTRQAIKSQLMDEEGIEVTQQNPQLSVQSITQHSTASTPDTCSADSSEVIRISRDDGQYKDIDTRRLQKGPEETQAKSLVNYAKSTRQFLSQRQRDPSEVDTLEVQTKNGDYEMRSSTVLSYEPGIQVVYQTQKKTYFLPKLVLLLVFLMTLIAGVVALIVKFHEPSPGNRGLIIADSTQIVECEDQSFQLGDSFEFSCSIATNHEFRKDLNRARLIKIFKQNTIFRRISQPLRETAMEMIFRNFPKTVSEPYFIKWSYDSPTITYSPKTTVTCSSEGTYNLEFLDQDNVTIQLRDPISLKITTKPSNMSVTFKQNLVDKCYKPDTNFDASCQRSDDCHIYQPLFFRRVYGGEDSLNHLMNCNYTFTDTSGYSINCSARLPDKLLQNDVYLGCRMMSQTDQSRNREEMFKLPTCDLQRSCTTSSRDVAYSGFNCTATSNHLRALNDGNCNFPYMTNCFKDRPVFKYYKDEKGNISCNEGNETIPVCRLSWCRNSFGIYTKEIPGIAICGNSYIEPGYN